MKKLAQEIKVRINDIRNFYSDGQYISFETGDHSVRIEIDPDMNCGGVFGVYIDDEMYAENTIDLVLMRLNTLDHSFLNFEETIKRIVENSPIKAVSISTPAGCRCKLTLPALEDEIYLAEMYLYDYQNVPDYMCGIWYTRTGRYYEFKTYTHMKNFILAIGGC